MMNAEELRFEMARLEVDTFLMQRRSVFPDEAGKIDAVLTELATMDQLWHHRTHTRMEALGWLVTALGVTGVILNNFRLWPCFVVWMVSNGVSALIHWRMRPRSLAVRDLIFFGLAAVGLWQWTH